MLVQHHDMLAQHNVKAVFNNGSAKLKSRHPELVPGSHYFKSRIQILK
jgi:hypothetical protein